MNPDDQVSLLISSLHELRITSFYRIVLLINCICYVGLIWLLWPANTAPLRFSVALLVGALVVITWLTKAVQKYSHNTASILLIISLIFSLGTLTQLSGTADVAHLFVVPVILAGILLGPVGIGLVTVGSAAFMLALTSTGITFQQLLFPIIMLFLTTAVVLVSIANFHTALAWALNGYESAWRNQNLAREQKARLAQALKSLDIVANSLHRSNYALEIARTQAEEARKIKQDFAQMISHELRTPLNLIVGFSETMIQSPEYYGASLPPLYMRDLSIVYRNASHLQSLVNDVLDLARLETAQISLATESTDLTAIAQDAAETARSLVESRGLTFDSEIDERLPTAWIDPVRVRQIIFNLLSNAARYTDRGRVTLRVWREDSEVTFAVSDTGIGIAEEKLEAIFEPFRQLGHPLLRRSGGAGLGLTISQQLARLHHGEIRVKSEVGVGSTFYFHLPLDYGEMLLPAHIDGATAAVSRRNRREDIVLLVSHSPGAASMVSRYLQTCRTIIIRDLEQAEQAARQIMPQVVIVDTSDEQLDVSSIHEIAASWNIPPFCLITCPLPGSDRLRDRLSANAYLTKPVSHNDLWDTLRQFGEKIDRILIVDDDQDFVHLIERMLTGPLMRYQVFSANGGREALEIMRYQQPDLVLLDLEMPDMDGFTFINQVRANPAQRGIQIVILSGQDGWDTSKFMMGHLTVTRPVGVSPSEILKWLRALVSDPTMTGEITRATAGNGVLHSAAPGVEMPL